VERRIALLLFLTLNFLYLLTSSGRVRTMDEVTVDYEAESLAKHGNTAIPQAVAAGYYYGKSDRFGRPEGPYGPGNAALVVPWYWMGTLAAKILPGIPKKMDGLFSDAFLTASSATFSAAAVALLFLLLRRKGISLEAAFFAAALTALATPLFSYSSWFFSEPLAALLLLAGLSWIFGGEAGQPIAYLEAALGGVFLGMLVWVRLVHAIALPVVALAMLFRAPRKNLRAAIVFCAVAGVFCAGYLLRNQYLFGNPFDVGYPQFGEGGRDLLSFNMPLLSGLRIFLFSPGKSIFLFAPPLLLAIPGLFMLGRKDRGLAAAIGGIFLVYLVFFSKYSSLEGAYSFGPRYLVPVIAILCLGLGPALEHAASWIRRSALVLGIAGFLVQAIGMATNFIEDMTTGRYYDAHWSYRPDYSPLPSMALRFWRDAVSPVPLPIGRGFDRWFVFLGKAGVPRTVIAAGIAFELAGLVYFAWKLRETFGAAKIASAPVGSESSNG
jgi:hypothetical protein